jgi:hypothetical protein
MPSLLSGSLLRRGGSGEFIDLASAQPQLPPTDSTSTGYTLVTDSLLRTSYRSSLGNIEFKNAELWSNLVDGTIRILATGTGITSTGTNTGLLVVDGDIGVGGAMYIKDDIIVNGITIGQGYKGLNNIVVRGVASPQLDSYENGQESIAIGYDTLLGIASSYKVIAIGRQALSSGTDISNTIALGDGALRLMGITTGTFNDRNIAIGIDSAGKLIDGKDNVFIGHEAAKIWTTGSSNIIIGQNTAKFVNTGSGIISIGGDNLVDGWDNQVNIGSVFYFDGRGYAYIAAETSIGLGTDSTGTSSGALIVSGGVGIAGNVHSGSCGIEDEDFLLYTPKIITTATQPASARLGDIWIDPTVPAYLQYIKDGTSTFWIQVGAV